LVIGIIAILAGIVIVAINPSKQLATVRNTQRKSDLKQIYNAITQYYIDNSAYPSTISTTTLNEVCNTGSVAATTTALNGASCGTLANLSVLVPTYLTAIPTDPTGTSSLLSFIPTAYAATTATGTGYKVGVNTAKQVLISAPLAELGVTVVVGNVPVAGSVPAGVSATGGTITYIDSSGLNPRSSPAYAGGYTVHTFTSSGTFTITSGGIIEYLVVGAGGAGGQGGGGGGGIITGSSSFATQSCTITVGPTTPAFSNGANSIISRIEGNLIGLGGGRGGWYGSGGGPVGSGGSGGGGLGNDPSYGGGAGLQGTTGGNYGYSGSGGQYATAGFSGGGGGAGGAGGGGSGGVANAGPGKLLWGTTYSKGGQGSYTFGCCYGANGQDNTGNGGEGSGAASFARSSTGGSGIVIVRYAN
jgi:type II secretory pathway pseudopilin PulG